MDYQLIRLYELVSRRIFRNLYAGVGYTLDWYFSVSNSGSASGQPTDFLDVPLRHRVDSVTPARRCPRLGHPRQPGLPARGSRGLQTTPTFPTWLGAAAPGTTSTSIYGSYHNQLAPWLVLALWTYGTFTFGHVPYLDLASNAAIPASAPAVGTSRDATSGNRFFTREAELRFVIWQWLAQSPG